MENFSLWGIPHAGKGEECEEEGETKTMCEELTTIPILCPPALLRVEEVENS